MNINQIIDECIAFHQLLAKLGSVTRADLYPSPTPQNDSKRYETDIEHSYFLAMFCWQVVEELQLDLSLEKIFKLALSHDLPEAFTGDTPLFSDKSKSEQLEDELKTLPKIASTAPQFKGLNVTLTTFYQSNEPEVRFVSAMDRLIALIVHINSKETQFVDNNITGADIEQALPEWKARIAEFPELLPFCEELLSRWFEKVELA